MRPPPPFVFDTPRQRVRSTIFSSVALSFLAPLFLLVCLVAAYLDQDAPFERRVGVEGLGGLRRNSASSSSSSGGSTNGEMGPPHESLSGLTDARAAVDALTTGAAPGVAVPLILNSARSHRTTWAILRHALQPLLPGFLRSAALEDDGDGLVALRAGGRGFDDDDAGLPGNGSHRVLLHTGRQGMQLLNLSSILSKSID
jgi:hypothetical protein